MKTKLAILFSSIFISFICLGMVFYDYPRNKCVFESIISKNPKLQNKDILYEKSELPENSFININTASLVELSSLPEIGIKLSQRIIEFREKNGEFEVIEDIMKVSGIGDKKFEKIKNYITV